MRDAQHVVAQRPRGRARGPDRPAATIPPTVPPGCESRGFEREALTPLGETDSSSASGVPARAVITSSLGS